MVTQARKYIPRQVWIERTTYRSNTLQQQPSRQAKFYNPNVAIDVATGLKNFMKTHGYHNLNEMRGIAQVKRHSEAHTDEKGHFSDLKNMILKEKGKFDEQKHTDD